MCRAVSVAGLRVRGNSSSITELSSDTRLEITSPITDEKTRRERAPGQTH
ncbi:hypothetical protein GDO81_022283 [Engystomops pustulosus]|uniref:Uncharacterized protein n=1 Tax=Engystomops pustulosus TaxID=76066 RepID=A0AAV6YN92_ENGPU|nr:hypothetical protein GDO81_022283 [Engystomops pustulosus]